jgi:chemosensory pili system protein ChpA (sensor histidine kinase/response regulator)
MYYLPRLLGDNEQPAEAQRYTPVLFLRSGNYHVALHVDEIIGNRESVMKNIGPQLARVPGIIGATVLGDGDIILIINPVQLANREQLVAGSVRTNVVSRVELDTANTIMVVDDSLTMRKVTSRLLIREGYQVVTAKDGMDALQQLQDVIPDVILLDIEMPRMDGFELARNIRDDERTKHIPLIVISSRTAEKHRAVAKEIGIDAYLGKPFQDEELLANIETFIKAKKQLAA